MRVEQSIRRRHLRPECESLAGRVSIQSISCAAFHLGRRERGGEAMAVIEVDAVVDNETLEVLRSSNQLLSARPID